MPMLTTGEPTGDPDEEPPADHRPALNKDAFDCPRCGTYAHQGWSPVTVSEGHVAGNQYVQEWRQAQCGRCNRPSVWRFDQMVYPLARLGAQPHEDMPAEVRALYEEAASVAAVSRRAGAALARAMVERLVKHLDPGAPVKANLDVRLDRIRPQVSTPLAEMLEVVRYVGNKMLHVEPPEQLGELVVLALDDTEGPPLVELLLETANDLVDELITKPKTVAALRDRLPPAIRAKLGDASGGSEAGDE